MQQKTVTLKKLFKNEQHSHSTPSFLFSCSVCVAFQRLAAAWKIQHLFQGLDIVACQRRSDESGEPVSNSCHQQNGQTVICQRKEGQVNCSLKTHCEGSTSNIPMPVSAMWLGLVSPRICWWPQRSASGGGSRASQMLRGTHSQERKRAQNRTWLPVTTAADQTVAAP